MKSSNWIPVALAAALVAACGGGGGSESPAATPSSVALSGVAAKGVLAQANVDVYVVAAGALDTSKSLAHAVSDANGNYNLPKFTPSTGAQYAVVVSANGTATTQLDEVTGLAQPMPADFSLHALLPNLDGGGEQASTVHVTPFSEMAFAAAQKKAFAPADVAQAVSNVAQLLGFDPRFVKPATIADAAAGTSAEAKKLAVMLTAVSQLAKDGGLGCSAADAGARAKCVVDVLAAQYKVDNTNPGTATTALTAAITTVVTANAANLPANLVDAIKEKLAGSGIPAPVDLVPGIAAVKALVAGLKADIISLIGVRTGTDHALKAQATLFQDTLTNVQEPVTVVARDADALLLAVELFEDYKTGVIPVTTTSRSRRLGTIKSNVNLANATQIGCAVYKADATTPATSIADAATVGCRVNYYTNVTTVAGVTTAENYRHGFTVTPDANRVNFAYLTRARKTVCVNAPGVTTVQLNCSGAARTSNLSLSPANLADGSEAPAYTGNLTVTRNNGAVTGLAFTGDLAAQFTEGGKGALANPNGKSTWTLNAALTTSGQRTTYAYNGIITAYTDQGTAVDSRLTIKPGSTLVTLPDEPIEFAFDVVAGNLKSQFEGQFNAGNSQLDKSGTVRLPLNLSLTGSLRNADANGVFADFLSGTVSSTISTAAWAAYDASGVLPVSASNKLATTLGFAGKLAAPNRPALSVSLSATGNNYDDNAVAFSGNFTTLTAAGAPSHVLTISGSEGAGLSFNETTSGISFTLQRNVGTTPITQNGKTVGMIDSDAGRINFSNGEFVSLDLGI